MPFVLHWQAVGQMVRLGKENIINWLSTESDGPFFFDCRIHVCYMLNMLKIFVLFLFVCPLHALASEIIIEGRVLTESGPLADAVVSAYRSYSDLHGGTSAVASASTDREGVYRLRLQSGPYYFVARGRRDGREYYAYHGSNPVKVEEQKFWLAFLATEEDPVPQYVDGSGTIEGVVTYKGEPVPGAYVALYPPDSKTFKGLGAKTESVGDDGRFRFAVQPGKYVMTGRKIFGGKSNRPPRKGDLYCYYSRNPLEVKENQTTRVEFSCYPKIDRTSFVATQPVKNSEFRTIAEQAADARFGIRGRVTGTDGRPLSGLTVMAHRLASPVFMMYNLYHGSEFTSETDSSGNFFIPLDVDGDYGIVARDTLGDAPHSGEIYGLYQGNTRHAVSFKKGTLVDNIAITAGLVMGPAAGQPSEPRVTPVESVVGSQGGAPVLLADSVISRDTVWQGEIHINGVISVKRGATLTIRPGTVIKFMRIDRDRNGIGDSEILVEGRLVARGAAEKRIVFTSAETKPGINDWSYLQFLASDPGNVIEQCQFEYAFAGIMIHFADVRISDCLFRNNNRGLHYNTANLTVEHSTFIENRIGIRCTRFEGDVSITANEISRNDIGVLFVRQHVNAVDFDLLNSGKEHPRIQGNNIENNRSYNFSLGEGQDRDVNVSGNWWGASQRKEIADLIFDRNEDEKLSSVIFEPYLSAAVRYAGVRVHTQKSIKMKHTGVKLH